MARRGVIKGRNVRGFYVVDGTVLFVQTGMVANFTNALSNAITWHVNSHAPTNKRPHYPFQGSQRLKGSITSASSKANPAAKRVTSAVGSKVGYALYVDQGTEGQMAKFMPPWKPEGGLGLFEATWRPGPTAPQVGPKWVSGQEGKHFFDKGVRDGMRSMGMTAGKRPEGATDLKGSLSAPFETNAGWTAEPGLESIRRTMVDAWRKERLDTWDQRRSDARWERAKQKREAANAASQAARDKIDRDKQKANAQNIERATEARKKAQIAQARRDEEAAKARKAREDAARAKELKKEREFQAKIDRSRALRKAQAEARAFKDKMSRRYKDATVFQRFDDGVLDGYWVRYTQKNGKVIWKSFG